MGRLASSIALSALLGTAQGFVPSLSVLADGKRHCPTNWVTTSTSRYDVLFEIVSNRVFLSTSQYVILWRCASMECASCLVNVLACSSYATLLGRPSIISTRLAELRACWGEAGMADTPMHSRQTPAVFVHDTGTEQYV